MPDFRTAYSNLVDQIKVAPIVHPARWQGVDVSQNKAAQTRELQNVRVEVDLRGIEDLEHWRSDCRPNLPWADDHFQERVGGQPLNPGVQWAKWPWASRADSFRKGEQFNHSYMERYWPKYADQTEGGVLDDPGSLEGHENCGIRHKYGDLSDLVDLLVRDPLTRQAWMPIFFPEDTGWADGGRKPCSLGYQFMIRPEVAGPNRMSVYYPMRSCDLLRHFRDDCYLTVRLLLWVLDQCRERSASEHREWWDRVIPGTFLMHATSLHIFLNDGSML